MKDYHTFFRERSDSVINCGYYSSFTVEEMYQAFKARMIAELKLEKGVESNES